MLYDFLAFLQIERHFTRAPRTLVYDRTKQHFRTHVLGEGRCPQVFAQSSSFLVKQYLKEALKTQTRRNLDLEKKQSLVHL